MPMPMASAGIGSEVIAPGDEPAAGSSGPLRPDHEQDASGQRHGRKRSQQTRPRSLAFGALHKLSPFSSARRAGQVTASKLIAE